MQKGLKEYIIKLGILEIKEQELKEDKIYADKLALKISKLGFTLEYSVKTIYNNYEVLDCIQKRIGEFNRNYRKNGEFYYSLHKELKESINDIL